MKKVLNYLKILIWPLLLIVSEFLLILTFTVFFNMKCINTLQNANPTLTDIELQDKFNTLIKTDEYVADLSNFLTANNLTIIIIVFIIFMPILIKKYKKGINESQTKLTKQNYIHLISSSILIALTLNLIIVVINHFIHITNRYDNINFQIGSFITTAILSPILEEYIFRGIIYNDLKKFNSKKIAMAITTFMFAIMHMSFSQIFYTLFIGAYLIYIYDKTQNIKVSILSHMLINASTLLFIPFIIKTNIYIEMGLIIIFILIFLKIFRLEIK